MKFRNKLIYLFILLGITFAPIAGADLLCNTVTSCAYTDILHMSDTSNAHAEQANETNYNYKICCYDTEGFEINRGCSGNYYNYLKLSSSTNAHVEKNTQSNYAFDACISNPDGNISCAYADSCYNYDACVATISSTEQGSNTNLHIADCDTNPYKTKICCTTSGVIAENYVTFEMEFNISGNSDDEAFADAYGVGYYTDLNKKYVCIQDRTITNNPAFGMVFGGRVFKYINLTTGNSYKMRLSQYVRGNRFILPITVNNCTTIDNLMPISEVAQTFVKFITKISTIELSLSYPAVDMSGDFQRTGSVSIIIEKNETDSRQIILSPVV
jgi:hypothetical protein